MKIAQTIDAIRAAREEYGLERWGLSYDGVFARGPPGASATGAEGPRCVIVTIYVNPKRFGPSRRTEPISARHGARP